MTVCIDIFMLLHFVCYGKGTKELFLPIADEPVVWTDRERLGDKIAIMMDQWFGILRVTFIVEAMLRQRTKCAKYFHILCCRGSQHIAYLDTHQPVQCQGVSALRLGFLPSETICDCMAVFDNIE